MDGELIIGTMETHIKLVTSLFVLTSNRLSQGRVIDGVMDGQALHFRWGDGSKFICEETKECMAKGVIVKELGKFRGVNRGPVDVSVRTKEYDNGWYVGQISNRGARRGEGTFYFLNGDRYIGVWSRDKMDGKGVYQYRNGDR